MKRLPLLVLPAVIVACGGVAVFDAGEGAGGTSSVSSTSVAISVTASSTGVGGMGGAGGEEPGGAPPIPPLVEEDLGSLPVGEPFEFTIPDGVLGFTIVAEARSVMHSVGIQTLRSPDEDVVISGYGYVGTLAQYIRPGGVTAAVPQTDHPDSIPVMGGTWEATLGSGSGLSDADVRIWYRQTLDGQFHGGVIDVNVYMVPGASNETYVKAVLAGAFDNWTGGLKLGTVTFSELSNEFSVVTTDNYVDLFETTVAAAGRPALNMMIVNNIDIGSNPLGFSPGAPGNPLDHGRLQSGVVFTLSAFKALDVVVVRHETGHFAGMFHTSEIEVGFGDDLADTPLCPDVPQQLLNCPDKDYLMFPYADPNNDMTMSPDQDRVVRGSAIYRGAVEMGGGYPEPLDQDEDQGGNAAAPSGQWRAGQWGVGLSPAAEHFMSLHWCPRTGDAPYAILQNMGVTTEALVALATDALAPTFMRARALRAVGRRGGHSALLTSVAQDASLPVALRTAASSRK